MTNEKKYPTILGAPERDRNPLRKLIAGFCDPFIPKHDEDDTVESQEFSPEKDGKERALPIAVANRNIPTTNNRQTVKVGPSSSVRFETLGINRSLHIPTHSANRNMSEITIETQDSIASGPLHDQTNTPEFEIAKSVVRRRRQHALSVFLASFVFVMAAVMTLQRLGYSIADFHAPTHSLVPTTSSSTRRPWIHIFHKTSIESGKIHANRKVPQPDMTKDASIERLTLDTIDTTDMTREVKTYNTQFDDKVAESGGPRGDTDDNEIQAKTTTAHEL